MDSLEVADAEYQVAHMQFTGLCQVVNYIIEAVYHHFVVGSDVSTKE